MKQLICLAVFLCLLFSACHDSDPAPAAADPLLRSWKVSRVTLDDTDVTAYYADLRVTFAAAAYRVDHAMPPVWPETGTYTVSGNQLKRNDDLTMDIVTLTDTGLTLRFQYQGVPLRGRLSEVAGKYSFAFVAE